MISPQSTSATPEDKSGPVVAWVSNSLPPYRLFSFRRIVNEIPEIQFRSLFTHGSGKTTANLPWTQVYPADIGPVTFHSNEAVVDSFNLRTNLAEWCKGKRIIQWLKQHKARAVIVGGYNDMGRVRVIRWCGRNGIPCFLAADSNILGDRGHGWSATIKRLFLPRLFDKCSGVLSCGSLGVEYFRRYDVHDERIFVAPYESDFQLFQHPEPKRIDQARDQFNLTIGRRRIVYSGRLVPVKRVDMLIDAFVELTSERPQWDLVLVGDGPLRESLLARIPSQFLNRVQWLGFVEEPAMLASIYQQCDVLALPSINEPWGIVVTEAVAAGLAVVASNVVGAAVELVRNGENGILFPVGQYKLLKKALLEVTDEHTIKRFRSASPPIFRQWRQSSDPIQGLRRALTYAKVL